MKPANDPHTDYKELVRDGYDAISDVYGAARAPVSDLGALGSVLDRLAPGLAALDIGCGAGLPVCRALAERGSVIGVDISRAQIESASRNVPTATFLCGDIMDQDFDRRSFDVVTAFYSIFHLPREEHEPLFRRVYQWLKPGGYFFVTLTKNGSDAYTEPDFFGVEMYWSNFGMAEYPEMLRAIGFEVVEQGGVGSGFADTAGFPPEFHPTLLLRRPADTP